MSSPQNPVSLEGMDVLGKFFVHGPPPANPKITIELEDDNCYLLPEQMLLEASDYFRAALKKEYTEGQTRVLVLPGCDKDTLDAFLHYLLTGKLPQVIALVPNTSQWVMPDPKHRNALAVALINLWAFADMVLMPKLQNIVMGHLVNLLCRSRTTPRTLFLAIDRTSLTSNLTKAFMRSAQYDFVKNKFNDETAGWFDSLATVPGVMQAWFATAHACNAEETQFVNGEGTVVLKFKMDAKDFMVSEGSKK